MSVVLKPASGKAGNIFVFYDFQQVRDAVLVVTYSEKSGCWEKIFVYNTPNGWETGNLRNYINENKFNWLNKKLRMIFNEQKKVGIQVDDFDLEKEMKQNADFFLGLIAVN